MDMTTLFLFNIMYLVLESDTIIIDKDICAVAIFYDRLTLDAPIVNTKGWLILARWIQFIAELIKMPIFENNKLAHDLFNSVDLFDYIDEEFFYEVSKIYVKVLYPEKIAELNALRNNEIILQ